MTVARISLAQPIESRSASTAKDARSVNCFFERRDQENNDNVKRPGTAALTLSGTIGASTSQGMYEWFGSLYVVTSNTLYKITSGLVLSTIGTLSGTVQDVYFAESADHTYLFFHNGSYGYVVNSAGTMTTLVATSVYGVTITVGGTGYSSPTCTFSAPDTGSDTATGTVQETGGVITGVTMVNVGSGYTTTPTISFAGGGSSAAGTVSITGFPAGDQTIAAGAVYLDGYTIVATKAGIIYNSESENPLLWNPVNFTSAESDPDQIIGIVKHFNYVCVFGEWGSEFFYDGQVAVGSPLLRQDSAKNEVGCPNGDSIVQFEQMVVFAGQAKTEGKSVFVLDGVTPKRISTRYIEKYLNANTTNAMHGFVFRMAGHTFYVMSLPTLDYTFVYDFDENHWVQWTSYYSAAEHAFSFWEGTKFNNTTVVLHISDGTLYTLSPDNVSDDGTAIYWRVITPNIDSGNMRRKFYHSGQIVGDKVTATMYISHSGDDYVTWSTARTVSLSKIRCILQQLAVDRRRAWQFLVTDNVALRFQDFELDLVGGEQEGDPQMPNGQANA